MSSRGFTLVELMITGFVMAIFCAATAGLVGGVFRSGQHAAGYVEDLTQCRRALTRLEADLRLARRVETLTGVVRVHRPGVVVDYALTRGLLTRTVDRRREVVARRIGAFSTRRDGRLVHLSLTLRPRARHPARTAVVHTTVYLRNGGRP